MAQAQRARWARAKETSQPVVAIAKPTGSVPCKAHHVSGSPQEDRGVSKSTVGENKISAEETCIVNLLGIQTNP
jgi:hypothetical protein